MAVHDAHGWVNRGEMCRRRVLLDLIPSVYPGGTVNETLPQFVYCISNVFPSVFSSFRRVPLALFSRPPPHLSQPDTALARPKFSLFKPSSELILKKIVDIRAAGESEPPPAFCAVYRRGEASTPSEQSPTQPR